jgi:Fibronectin type III domain
MKTLSTASLSGRKVLVKRFTGQAADHPTRLFLAAMLMSSVYLVACGGSDEGETSAQEGPTETAESTAPPPPPPPPAPTGTAALSWTASPDANVSGYRVYYGTAPGAYSQPRGSGLPTGNTTSWTVSGLNPGTLYYFAVTAVDSQGNESAYSNEASKVLP